ncbi:cardiolipin synthase [Psychroserpens burtonensis]|uniref:Cardiolipin synthase n=1 Tax=Psychroserpens burtonensis TaxID=49278 RepID=A0A5C7BCK5_9FLAO|nr:cardiolipin synthase [Psychroserpens burtonensis]TXE20013.1 cardiolipin synthase [Psychroserpens burtonensis]
MLDYLTNHTWVIAIVINYLLALTAIITILLKNVDPTKTLSYIMVLVFVPFFGLFVYYMFGQEYRKTKLFNRKDISNRSVIKSVGKNLRIKEQDFDELNAVLDEKIKLVKLLKASEKSPLTLRNDIDILVNGKIKFERLFQDLKDAKNFIHIEYYVIKDDKIGTQFLDILCAKAKDGLEVKMTYDDVGSCISSKMKRKINESGIEHRAFMPVWFSSLTGKSNYRNHRKIAIIDGEIGYVGGINISDSYVNYEDSSTYWRDTHLRIYGEAVKVLQFHFLTTWDFVTEEEIEIKKIYFPEIECDQEIPVQIAASGPDTDWANIMEAILTAINNAEEYIYLTTPYFIPNDQIVTALQIAARVGLDVRLIIPKESDSWVAQRATASYLEPLLEAGVKVYLYKRGFIHAKTMVVDDIFGTIGTCNMDNRSFNINFEINALIYHNEKCKKLKSIFLEDLEDCETLKYEYWKERSKYCKLQESLSRLWAPLL